MENFTSDKAFKQDEDNIYSIHRNLWDQNRFETANFTFYQMNVFFRILIEFSCSYLLLIWLMYLFELNNEVIKFQMHIVSQVSREYETYSSCMSSIWSFYVWKYIWNWPKHQQKIDYAVPCAVESEHWTIRWAAYFINTLSSYSIFRYSTVKYNVA